MNTPTVPSSQELRQHRAELVRDLHSIDSADSLLQFQLRLADSIRITERARLANDNEDLSWHLHLLRVIGDSLAWKYLHPHVIRQLAKNPGRHPHIESQGKAFAFTLEATSRLAQEGMPVLISDLTHCLRIADIVIAADPEVPSLIECKSSGAGPVNRLRGRARRQYSRMKGTLDYLRTGRAKIFGEVQERVVVEVRVKSEHNWAIVDAVTTEALRSGVGSMLVSPNEFIFAYRDTGEVIIPNEIRETTFDPSGMMVAAHTRPIEEAWSSVPPPLAWKINGEARVALFEGDVTIVHLFNPNALVGRSSSRARIVAVDTRVSAGDHGYAV